MNPRGVEQIQEVVIARHSSMRTILDARRIIEGYFDRDLSYYQNLSASAYRDLVASAQDQLNELSYTVRICHEIKGTLCDILGSSDILVQTNCYLRAARPNASVHQEVVGWHRESFYGPNMEHAVNVWTPIANVCSENTLRYIPGSSTISDDDIIVTQYEDKETPRFSSGHKIGLRYAPKIIIGGVDFSKSTPMIVEEGASAIFSANLIHGAAHNNTGRICFSLDFRAIAKSSYRVAKYHFASGREYFAELP